MGRTGVDAVTVVTERCEINNGGDSCGCSSDSWDMQRICQVSVDGTQSLMVLTCVNEYGVRSQWLQSNKPF